MKYIKSINESIKSLQHLEFDGKIPTNLSKREDEMIRNTLDPYVDSIKTEFNKSYGDEQLYYFLVKNGKYEDHSFRIYKEDYYYYCSVYIWCHDLYDEPYIGKNRFDSLKELLTYLKLTVTMAFCMYDELIGIIDSIDFDMDMDFDGNEIYEILFGDYRVINKEMSHLTKLILMRSIRDNKYIKQNEEVLEMIKKNHSYLDKILSFEDGLRKLKSQDGFTNRSQIG